MIYIYIYIYITHIYIHMEVSENGATPKSSNLINRMFPYKPSSYWVSP